MADQAAIGKKALEAAKYDEAITAYTTALKSSPTSPDYLIQRATAYQRAQKYPEALNDANRAVLNAKSRGKKELIIEGQFRRGCALYSLGRYGDAEFVFGVVQKMKSDHKQVAMWINKTALSLKNLPADDEKRICKVQETPDGSTLATETETLSAQKPSAQVSAPAVSAPPQQTPADKIRQDWYQNSQNVYFTLLAKGVPKEAAQVEITPRSLTISFPTPGGSSYDLTLEPLFAAVKVDECISRILPTKIEIVLVKASPGQKWSALESSEPIVEKADSPTETGDSTDTAVQRAVFSDHKVAGPAYPTSSKSGPKNWDKITGEEEDDEDEGGDPANAFFKKLFKGASPETQRAMMKSYTESNGTALSTNWDEVSKGPVETQPPDSMVAKKWSQ